MAKFEKPLKRGSKMAAGGLPAPALPQGVVPRVPALPSPARPVVPPRPAVPARPGLGVRPTVSPRAGVPPVRAVPALMRRKGGEVDDKPPSKGNGYRHGGKVHGHTAQHVHVGPDSCGHACMKKGGKC